MNVFGGVAIGFELGVLFTVIMFALSKEWRSIQLLDTLVRSIVIQKLQAKNATESDTGVRERETAY